MWNVLQLAALGEQFDTVIDSGLFHVLEDDDRREFVDQLKAVIPPGGRYLMMCFSERQPGDYGPRRVSQAEIQASFGEAWRIDSIEPAKFEIRIGAGEALAWQARITRI